MENNTFIFEAKESTDTFEEIKGCYHFEFKIATIENEEDFGTLNFDYIVNIMDVDDNDEDFRC